MELFIVPENDPVLKYNKIDINPEQVEEYLNTYHFGYIASLFTWMNTPQNGNYWMKVSSGKEKITPEGLSYIKWLYKEHLRITEGLGETGE